MNPFEEVRDLIDKLKQVKSTIEETDLEYFERDKMNELASISKEVSKVAYKAVSDMYDSHLE